MFASLSDLDYRVALTELLSVLDDFAWKRRKWARLTSLAFNACCSCGQRAQVRQGLGFHLLGWSLYAGYTFSQQGNALDHLFC